MINYFIRAAFPEYAWSKHMAAWFYDTLVTSPSPRCYHFTFAYADTLGHFTILRCHFTVAHCFKITQYTRYSNINYYISRELEREITYSVPRSCFRYAFISLFSAHRQDFQIMSLYRRLSDTAMRATGLFQLPHAVVHHFIISFIYNMIFWFQLKIGH